MTASLFSIRDALRPLRPYQERGLHELRVSIQRGHRRVMYQAPTGSGKTEVAEHIVHGARRKRKRVTFIVPKLNLN